MHRIANSEVSKMQTYMRVAMTVVALTGATANAAAQEVVKGTCGSMSTMSWAGDYPDFAVDLNKGTTQKRECFILNVPEMSATMHSPAIVRIAHEGADDLYYEAEFDFTAEEALTAVEIRFLVFDIWRESIKTLSATYIDDIEKGQKISKTGFWRARQNEAKEHYASIGYVARVRTRGGEIRIMPIEHVLSAAREFAADFSEEDLEPQE